MNNNPPVVTCGSHGERAGAYLCQHLIDGSNLGFHWGLDEENPDSIWPDAWCDDCDAMLPRNGEWGEITRAFVGVKLVCDLCYEQARSRNWRQDTGVFDRLCCEAVAYLKDKQAETMKEFRISEYERYDWDQDTGQLIFSHNGKARVIGDIAFVGSISVTSNTWLWSWANTSLMESVRGGIREVRRYGEENGFIKLASARWTASEVDGWEMTAIAAFLLSAIGAYRTPKDNGFTFMIISKIRWAA
jgi:hypothetical protein